MSARPFPLRLSGTHNRWAEGVHRQTKGNSMKVLLLVSTLFAAIQVSAANNCPALEGAYSCSYKGFGIGASVRETKGAGFTSYFIDYRLGQVTIVPDGKEHTIDRLPPLDRQARNFRYKAYCKGQRVDFNGTGDMTDGSGQANLSGSLVDQGAQIVIDVALTGAKSQNVHLVCDRQ